MNTHADRKHDNKCRSVANEVYQHRSSGESTFQFVDNRPEAIAQRKLQEMANNGPQAKQAAQLQAMADNYSKQQQPIQKKENKTGLPDSLKSGIENLSGDSMDDVKVHYNSDKPAQLQAHAYAQGTDIHIASGQEKHLPHEAWHVVQQKQGRVKPTMQMKGKVNVNDDAGLEKEADVMGAEALQLQTMDRNISASTRPLVNRSTQGGPVLQGKFGFEIETKLILSAGAPNADTTNKLAFTKPDQHLNSYPKVAKGNTFSVHLDHNSAFKRDVTGGPIAEMVTDPPINEATQTEDEAAQIAQNMADAVTSMGAAPGTPSKLSTKQNINSVQATGADIYVGFPGATGQGTHGYVQATFGVKLAAIPKMLTHMAKTEMASSPKAAKIFTATVADASGVTNRLKSSFTTAMGAGDYGMSESWTTHHDDGHNHDFRYHKESGTSQWNKPTNAEQITQDFKQLEGYLALVLQYLIAGRDFKAGEVPTNLLKNAIGQFFYKTKLSTLAGRMQGWAKYMVENVDWRAETKREILAACGRAADENMSRAMTSVGVTTVEVGTWLDNVFSGTSDNIFDDSINPWSDELVDSVGASGHEAPSAVIENRRVNPLGGPKKITDGATPQEVKGWMGPSEWPALARYYHQMVTALNNPIPDDPPESVAP